MSFTDALAFTLAYEGGYSDHPRDPGGATNRGITQRKLDEVRAVYRAAATTFPASVRDLTPEQTAWIYRTEYWDRLSCDGLPGPLALVVFDAGVNCGIGRAARWLQQALRVKVDGVVGAQTIAAAQAADVREVVTEVMALRTFHHMLLDDLDDTFGLGWARRLMKLQAEALA